jgi:hypothetical protein
MPRDRPAGLIGHESPVIAPRSRVVPYKVKQARSGCPGIFVAMRAHALASLPIPWPPRRGHGTRLLLDAERQVGERECDLKPFRLAVLSGAPLLTMINHYVN